MSEGCRICTRCSDSKPLECFATRSDTGKTRRQCKQCFLEVGNTWRRANPDKIKPPVGEAYIKKLESARRWREANLAYDAARAQAYRTRKLNQMPPWADAEVIFQFYDNCPEGYHVDHIVPLKGKTVRGFHVIENLQYLPARENIRKGNRYE